ncbi:hypothetical protein [Acinetobacter sp. ANC 3791]|uniref:hypothetical protein n=1 Tax=Acinetobacter sp. ANC 3791 TaxID=2529836 RepID=UPI0010397E48|nr:hypothetical protein [Acinetobacter sp. ANC 3791]TCB86277.1 hypothetical protein E0H90_00145 [Acinetobacter sp. ANC 3791]
MSVCFYCAENEAIENSHVISKFVSDWVKETSETGYLRTLNNINQREQDGEKLPILCPTCEQVFGKFENLYKQHSFSKIANYRNPLPSILQISDSDKKFILSLFWRQIIRLLNFDPHDKIYQDELDFLQKKADILKKYIDDIQSYDNCNDFSVYLIPLHEQQVNSLGLPFAATSNYYEYERLIFGDFSFHDNFKQAWIMVKLPFHILICDLMKHDHEWNVPEISMINELKVNDIISVPDNLKHELQHRLYDQVVKANQEMSDEQRNKIIAAATDAKKKKTNESGSQKSMTRSHTKKEKN